MTWIKLDTAIFRNKKMMPLTDVQQLGYIRILTWAGESSEDGHVPDFALRELRVSEKSAIAMESTGLLHRNGTGWVIHDWDDHQGSLIKRREADRIRKRKERGKEDES